MQDTFKKSVDIRDYINGFLLLLLILTGVGMEYRYSEEKQKADSYQRLYDCLDSGMRSGDLYKEDVCVDTTAPKDQSCKELKP